MQPQPINTQSPWWSKMVLYWLDNQISITFHSELPLSAGKQAIIESLNLPTLNQFLNMRGYTLHSFTQLDIPHPANGTDNPDQPPTSTPWSPSSQSPTSSSSPQTTVPDDLNSLAGKHFFQPHSGYGTYVTCFFHIERTSAYSTSGWSIIGPFSNGYGSSSPAGYVANDTTRTVINLLNSARNDVLRQPGRSTVVTASPNWLSGATPMEGCGTHGCPIVPPVPVEQSSAPWHLALPDLAPAISQRTGAGVTVFVLDTRPSLPQITAAAERAGNNNPLLQKIVSQINDPSPAFVMPNPDHLLPSIIENGSLEQPITGRDIFGRLSGFAMPDHGLFVAGIIRDVAPSARIEFIRVLNDFGVGTLSVLTETLEAIHNRMLRVDPDTGMQGNLYQKPVVINLSLVTIPHQEEFVPLWSGGAYTNGVQRTSDTEPLPLNLHAIIQSLTALGAVVVGSAGNDSDLRQSFPLNQPKTMQVTTQRALPRYPAAFPEVLSVGAVDQSGHAAVYSNYPVAPGSTQNNGIATYGGGIPTPSFPSSISAKQSSTAGAPFDPDTMMGIDRTQMDALVGLYTSPTYPSLSADDQPREYTAPNNNALAYWSGTSFATPIVSGTVARLLEELIANLNLRPDQWHAEVMKTFTNSQQQQYWLSGDNPLPREPEFSRGGVTVSLLNAKQVNIPT